MNCDLQASAFIIPRASSCFPLFYFFEDICIGIPFVRVIVRISASFNLLLILNCTPVINKDLFQTLHIVWCDLLAVSAAEFHSFVVLSCLLQGIQAHNGIIALKSKAARLILKCLQAQQGTVTLGASILQLLMHLAHLHCGRGRLLLHPFKIFELLVGLLFCLLLAPLPSCFLFRSIPRRQSRFLLSLECGLQRGPQQLEFFRQLMLVLPILRGALFHVMHASAWKHSQQLIELCCEVCNRRRISLTLGLQLCHKV